MLQAVCIVLAVALVLLPPFLAFIHLDLVSSWYQPDIGWWASLAAALTLLAGYLALAAKPIPFLRHFLHCALVTAGVALTLCLALPWTLQRGLAISPSIVDALNGVHQVAYLGLFIACAAALAARCLTVRIDALSQRLTHRQLDALQRAIEQAYRGDAEQLDRAIAMADVDPSTYGAQTSLPVLRSILQDAEAHGRIADVVGALRRAKGADEVLADIESRLLRTTDATDRTRLEGMVLAALRYRPAAQWVQQLQATFPSVCRVERASDGASMGTGFLVGEGLVLTNHHVVYPGLDRGRVAVQFRFDAQSNGGGVVVHPDPQADVLAASPPGGTERGLVADPAPDELDFVVVKLDPSERQLWSRAALPLAGAAAAAGHPLLILEHPLGAPLQICFGSVKGMNKSATRLHHTATTQQGSSGSPCLSMELAVVAVHNGGSGTRHNNAIPIPRIVTALRARGIAIPSTEHP